MTPLGNRFRSSSFLRKGAALPCAFQSGRHTTWWTPRASAQLARDLLDAGTAAVQQNHVVVLRPRAVERGPDGGAVRDLLAAGDGDQGALRQVRAGLAVLAGAAEVGGRRWRPT